MGGHRGGSGGENIEWPEKSEDAFLKILLKRVQMDPNGAPSFKASDYKEMDEELFKEVGVRFGVNRLKGKYNRLRTKHRNFSELLEHTGVTYDSNKNIVYALEDVWQHFFQKGKNFRAFRSNGCRNYELLGQVFNKSTATGLLHQASTQLPPSSDEEREMEDTFLNNGVHVDEAGSSRGKGKRAIEDDQMPGYLRAPKNSKYDFLKDAVSMWQSSCSTRDELNRAKLEKIRSCVPSTPESNQVTANDQFSIDKCLEVIHGLPELSDAAYAKAVEKLESFEWRKIFMKMLPARREDYLKNLG